MPFVICSKWSLLESSHEVDGSFQYLYGHDPILGVQWGKSWPYAQKFPTRTEAEAFARDAFGNLAGHFRYLEVQDEVLPIEGSPSFDADIVGSSNAPWHEPRSSRLTFAGVAFAGAVICFLMISVLWFRPRPNSVEQEAKQQDSSGGHQVVSGETLSAICEKVKSAAMSVPNCVEEIVRINDLTGPNDIEIGDILRVPASSGMGMIYRVSGRGSAISPPSIPSTQPGGTTASRPPCDFSASPLYCVCAVQPGDTLRASP